jgi:hypothetical protein
MKIRVDTKLCREQVPKAELHSQKGMPGGDVMRRSGISMGYQQADVIITARNGHDMVWCGFSACSDESAVFCDDERPRSGRKPRFRQVSDYLGSQQFVLRFNRCVCCPTLFHQPGEYLDKYHRTLLYHRPAMRAALFHAAAWFYKGGSVLGLFSRGLMNLSGAT